MDRLTEALNRHAADMEVGLSEARQERDELRARDRVLTDLIERAERALGVVPSDINMTLHEAIALILTERDNQWTHTREIADEVNERNLYRKRDGSTVEPNQIHARTKNYSHLFEKDGPLVRLRTGSEPVATSPSRSKYDPLGGLLSSAQGDSVTLSFEEIGELVGSLPASARNHQAWWANERSGSHVQARSWLGAGFRTAQVDQTAGWVRFERKEQD